MTSDKVASACARCAEYEHEYERRHECEWAVVARCIGVCNRFDRSYALLGEVARLHPLRTSDREQEQDHDQTVCMVCLRTARAGKP